MNYQNWSFIVNMTEGSRNVLYLSVLYFFTNPFLLHIWKTWKISSERKVKKRTWDIQVSVFWRSSRGRLESTSQECPLNVRLGRLPDVRLRHPQDGQIGSLRDVLGMLQGEVLGTSWELIFAGWDKVFLWFLQRSATTDVQLGPKYASAFIYLQLSPIEFIDVLNIFAVKYTFSVKRRMK